MKEGKASVEEIRVHLDANAKWIKALEKQLVNCASEIKDTEESFEGAEGKRGNILKALTRAGLERSDLKQQLSVYDQGKEQRKVFVNPRLRSRQEPPSKLAPFRDLGQGQRGLWLKESVQRKVYLRKMRWHSVGGSGRGKEETGNPKPII